MIAIALRRAAKATAASLLLLLATAMLYFGSAFGLLLVPVDPDPPAAGTGINAYLISNGVHTEFVLPVQALGIDWRQIFPPEHLKRPPAAPDYIAIGWGDREFYLNTPRWEDLTARRAIGALAGNNRTLMHIAYFQADDLPSDAYRLPISETRYRALADYIRRSLPVAGGSAIVLPGRGYGANDAFYEAHGSYSLFNTCNTWIGRGLQIAGAKVSRWTPLESTVVWHLERRRR